MDQAKALAVITAVALARVITAMALANTPMAKIARVVVQASVATATAPVMNSPYNRFYAVKLFRQRWYLLARLTNDEMRVYALDRMSKARLTDDTFKRY